MQIFDEIKSGGVEDVLFICMDGVSGLEEGAKSIFKYVVVQRCVVHLIRNSIKYIPSKEYKAFTTTIHNLRKKNSALLNFFEGIIRLRALPLKAHQRLCLWKPPAF